MAEDLPENLDTDRKKVRYYFERHSREILGALEQNKLGMQALARRRGSRYGNFILDTGDPDLRDLFRHLSQIYNVNTTESEPDSKTVSAVSELLNKVRNNVFHGRKVPDNAGDIAVLNLVTPILISIIEACE